MILSTSEKKLVLSLLQISGIGRSTVLRVVEQLRAKKLAPEDIFRHTSDIENFSVKLKHILQSFNNIVLEQKYCSLIDVCLKENIRVIWQDDAKYPSCLLATEDPPLCLFVKGNVEALSKPCIAVVGTRKITTYGIFVTKKITKELLQNPEVTIVSGCMYGVDANAHQTVLQQGRITIGVLGYGFLHCYPWSIGKLLESIVENGGCLVSEYLPDVSPKPGFFLARNRIIAGLSLATIVIEAGKRSGSHVTALRAAELGRDVFAVPGPITSPYSEGTKELINEGATLITNGNEVLEHLQLPQDITGIFSTLDDQSASVLRLLALEPRSDSQLAQDLGVAGNTLAVMLTELELQGSIERNGILWYLR